jgi:hypothetical protein
MWCYISFSFCFAYHVSMVIFTSSFRNDHWRHLSILNLGCLSLCNWSCTTMSYTLHIVPLSDMWFVTIFLMLQLFFTFSFFAWKLLILTSSNTFIFPYYSWFVAHIEEYNAKSNFTQIYLFGFFSPKYSIDFLLSFL